MKNRNRTIALIAGLGIGLGAGYALRAVASGIPSTAALTYAGVLETATGPVTGSHNIQIYFYDSVDASASGDVLCFTPAATSVAVTDGHFSLLLPDTCTTAVAGDPNVWVDVLVDGVDTGRTKIGAVPYAVEANHAPNADNAANAANATNAVNATNAADGGGIATEIAALQAAVTHLQAITHAPSGFAANLSTNPTVTPGAVIAFDTVSYDLAKQATGAAEYNNTTGVFTPVNAGVYLLVCDMWAAAGANTRFTTQIYDTPAGGSATELMGIDSLSGAVAGWGLSAETSVVAHLGAGDSVTCRFSPAAAVTVGSGWTNRDYFSAIRLN